jgi:hypothetical protein
LSVDITVPRSGRPGLNMKSGVGNTLEYNLVQGGKTWPENLYYSDEDPMLVNPGAADFHLRAGSPAIDSGDNSNTASTDADGNARSQDGSGLGYAIVDLGAYESVQDGTGGATGSGSASEFIIDFDAPTPPGSSNSLLSGVFEGLDFGQGQWRWEEAWNVNPTNHIFFDSNSGLSTNFEFAAAPAVLTGMRVVAGKSGVLTLTDERRSDFHEISVGEALEEDRNRLNADSEKGHCELQRWLGTNHRRHCIHVRMMHSHKWMKGRRLGLGASVRRFTKTRAITNCL